MGLRSLRSWFGIRPCVAVGRQVGGERGGSVSPLPPADESAYDIGNDKSATVRPPVQARSSVDANRPKRTSKALEGSLCGSLPISASVGF